MKKNYKVLEGIRDLREYLESGIDFEDEKIGKITYYQDFKLLPENNDFYGLNVDMYIVSRQREGKSDVIELYNAENILIGVQGKDKKIRFSEQYKQHLEDKFQDYYEKLGIEEREIFLNQVKDKETGKRELVTTEEDVLENLEEKDKEKATEEAHENEENKFEQKEIAVIEEELGLEKGDMQSFTLIKGHRIKEIAPEAKDYNNVGVAYVKSKNSFVTLGESKKAGHKTEILNTIDAAKDTRKTVVDVNRDGRKVERNAIKGMMKINDGDNEHYLGIELGPYGIIELKELRRAPGENEFMSTDLETEHQYPVTREVYEFMNKAHNPDLNDEMKKFKEKEEKGQTQVTKKEIDDTHDEMDDERTIHDRGNAFFC